MCDFVSFLHFICSISKKSTCDWYEAEGNINKFLKPKPDHRGCNRLSLFQLRASQCRVSSNRKKDSIDFCLLSAKAQTGARQQPGDISCRMLKTGKLTVTKTPPPLQSRIPTHVYSPGSFLSVLKQGQVCSTE